MLSGDESFKHYVIWWLQIVERSDNSCFSGPKNALFSTWWTGFSRSNLLQACRFLSWRITKFIKISSLPGRLNHDNWYLHLSPLLPASTKAHFFCAPQDRITFTRQSVVSPSIFLCEWRPESSASPRVTLNDLPLQSKAFMCPCNADCTREGWRRLQLSSEVTTANTHRTRTAPQGPSLLALNSLSWLILSLKNYQSNSRNTRSLNWPLYPPCLRLADSEKTQNSQPASKGALLLLLSCFSRVWLCTTP